MQSHGCSRNRIGSPAPNGLRRGARDDGLCALPHRVCRIACVLALLAALLPATQARAQVVRGFADLHAHWFASTVNGGSEVYCWDTHQFGTIPPAQQAACALKGSGYPNFNGRPSFGELEDQKAFVEWIKRSWEYGLRLVVMMAVYNDYGCQSGFVGRYLPPEECRVEKRIKGQIAEMKTLEKWVAQNDGGWLRIAYTPQEARNIIQQGKLAVVLGVEVDDLPWALCLAPTCTPEQYTAGLRRLHGLGVRHVIPIHAVNNDFGGAAFFREVYGLTQLKYNGAYFGTRACSAQPATFDFWGRQGLWYEAPFLDLAGFFLGYFPPAAPTTTGQCNSWGLTGDGSHVLTEMMRLGMLIDIDHMSELAFDHTYAMATDTNLQLSLGRTTPYPLISSHTSFRDMLPDWNDPAYHHLLPATRRLLLRGEFHKTNDQINKIITTGGMIAPILAQTSVSTYSGGRPGAPANNCTQSSRTWAQVLMRAVDVMGGKDVAIGTDVNGMAPFPGPRFGGSACGMAQFAPTALLYDPTRFLSFGIEPLRLARDLAAQHGSRLDYATSSVDGKPLTQLVTGNRVFDINDQGVAHYGMVPDLFADLRNVGVPASDIDVLFNSAEAYLQKWDSVHPVNDFTPAVTGPTYLGISATAPADYIANGYCPNNGNLGFDARWWEARIDMTDVSGFGAGALAFVSNFPPSAACFIDGTASTPIRVAIPIAPVQDPNLANYDFPWEVTVREMQPTGLVDLTKGVKIDIPRPGLGLSHLGDTVEVGDCPASAFEPESINRELLNSAIYIQNNRKIRHDMEAVALPHVPDFTATFVNWTAENPYQGLSGGQQASVDLCACGNRLVRVRIDESLAIETVEESLWVDSPPIHGLRVQQTHYDRFGNLIPDPFSAGVRSAKIVFRASVPAGTTMGTCAWSQLRWADAGESDPAAAEAPLPPARFTALGCDSSVTVWDPTTDPGTEPWSKVIRGVVTTEDGAQCGAKSFHAANDMRVEPEGSDVVLRPLRPLRLRIPAGAGEATRTVRLKVHNPGDRDTPARDVTLAISHADCPEGTIAGEPDFDRRADGDQSTVSVPAGATRTAKLRVRATSGAFTSTNSDSPARCAVTFAATVADGTDRTANNSEVLEIDVTDSNDAEQPGAVEVYFEPVRRKRVVIDDGEAYGSVTVRVTLVNAGSVPASVTWAAETAGCSGDGVGPLSDEVVLELGERRRIEIGVTAFAYDFPAADRQAPGRCHVALSATAAGDVDPTNNVTSFFVDVSDRNPAP